MKIKINEKKSSTNKKIDKIKSRMTAAYHKKKKLQKKKMIIIQKYIYIKNK